MSSDEITSTHEMAEADWDHESEPRDVDTDMVATKEAEGRGIEFHVSMRDYTMRDMEALIIEAAAALIVGRHNDRELARTIEAKCIEQITAKADKALDSITSEIINEPITPKYPWLGKDGEKPVTMREFIALTGQAYLTARVGRHSGKENGDDWASDKIPRVQYLVESYVKRQFKGEIEKTTNAAVAEIQREIRAKHEALLTAEKARLRAALDKVTSA